MKKLLTIALLFVSSTAFAQWHHNGHWRSPNNNWTWVAPSIIGGAIGYEIARQQPVQPPIIIQQQPAWAQPAWQQPVPWQRCSSWTEIQNQDGTITRTRTCTQ